MLLLEWSDGGGEEDALNIIHLSRKQDKFALALRERTEDDTFDLEKNKPVAFTINNYQRWFQRRGCDEDAYTRRIYDRARENLKEVNESNVDLACAWLVQLSYDAALTREHRATFASFDELRDEVQSVFEEFYRQFYRQIGW